MRLEPAVSSTHEEMELPELSDLRQVWLRREKEAREELHRAQAMRANIERAMAGKVKA